MNKQYSLAFDAGQNLVHVTGELSFTTVSAVLLESKTVFEPVADLNIDLATVSRSDSAGVALLVNWMRTAKQKNKSITFHNIPDQMLAIASASGLDELLVSA